MVPRRLSGITAIKTDAVLARNVCIKLSSSRGSRGGVCGGRMWTMTASGGLASEPRNVALKCRPPLAASPVVEKDASEPRLEPASTAVGGRRREE